MTRYRKRALEVEAVQWTGENRDEVTTLTGGRGTVSGSTFLLASGSADVGDWVVRCGDDLPYPVSAAEFEATYEPADQPAQGVEGHRVEIEFDGFYPSVKLIHPDGGCPLPDAVCEGCGRDLRDTEAERCPDCKAIELGYCGLTDWVEAEGHELVRGKATFPIRTEWATDRDHPLLHLVAAPAQPGVERGELEGQKWTIYVCEICGGSTDHSGAIEPRCTCEGGLSSPGDGIEVVPASTQPLLDLDAKDKRIAELEAEAAKWKITSDAHASVLMRAEDALKGLGGLDAGDKAEAAAAAIEKAEAAMQAERAGESKADGEGREAAALLDAATHFQRIASAHELRPDGDSSKTSVYREVAECLRSFVPRRLRDTEGL